MVCQVLICGVVGRIVRVVMYCGRGVRVELWRMASADIKMWYTRLCGVWHCAGWEIVALWVFRVILRLGVDTEEEEEKEEGRGLGWRVGHKAGVL